MMSAGTCEKLRSTLLVPLSSLLSELMRRASLQPGWCGRLVGWLGVYM
jgi:hypothetical protein